MVISNASFLLSISSYFQSQFLIQMYHSLMDVYKKCFASTSHVTRELHVKTTMRHCYTHAGMVKIPNTANTEHWEDVQQQDSHSLLMGMQNVPPLQKNSLGVSYKTKHISTTQSSGHVPWYLLKWTENMSTQKPAGGCLEQLYSWLPKFGSNQNVLQ